MRPRIKIILLLIILTPWGAAPQALALDAKGWFDKGNDLSQRERFKEAAQAYEKSIALNAKSPAAYYNLGIAYKNLNEHEKAVSVFKKTIELEPTHMDARLSLGNVYNRLNQWENAIAQLNVVVHRRRNDAEAHGNLGWAYYNYKKGPPFKQLVILNLKKAVSLFDAQNMREAAEATQRIIDEAIAKFGYETTG